MRPTRSSTQLLRPYTSHGSPPTNPPPLPPETAPSSSFVPTPSASPTRARWIQQLTAVLQTIPLDFKMVESSGTYVYLLGLSGQLWRTSIVLQYGRYYFKSGWAQFREDNKLDFGDLLVFTRIEPHFFKVEVFDGDSFCAKREAKAAKNMGKGLQKWGQHLGSGEGFNP